MTKGSLQESAPAANYLTPFSSVFLDAVRLLAALDVAFTHARAIWFPNKEDDLIPSHLSHGSVIIFFVLSGYVIAYTMQVKKRSAAEYAIARVSRLYSFFLPALIFTVLVSLILFYSDPASLERYTKDNSALRYIISLFFCNEIWFLSAAPLINGVIWSLSYEFWFYTIFGSWIYRHIKKGMMFLIIACIIAGPKILIMMPIWMLGVWAYKFSKPAITPVQRFLLIIASLIISVAIMLSIPQLPYKLNTSHLYWASSFMSDFIAALFIAFAFWLLPLSKTRARTAGNKILMFRKLADTTFPLYVFHYPCLVLCRSFMNLNNNYSGVFTAFFCTLIFCFIIGLYAERLQHLFADLFRNLLNKAFFKNPIPVKTGSLQDNS